MLTLALAGCTSLGQDNAHRADLHMQIGTSHFDNGNYTLALKEMLEAAKLDPRNPLVQNNLGLAYFMKERHDLAETHLRKALSLKENYSDARNNLARVLMEAGRLEEAEAELNKVVADLTYTGAAKAWINMGLIRFNQKKWKSAGEAFSQALRESRDSCIANSYYGRSLFEAGNYKSATEHLDRAVGFCQRELFDEPHYYSALAWYRYGDQQKSVARFREILKLYPEGRYRAKAAEMLELIGKGVE